MIGIVDYGLGNVQAFLNILRSLDVPAQAVSHADALLRCSHLILPGVGAFDHALDRLNGSGMLSALNQKALIDKVPVLGVCVGMQIMAHSSDEGSGQGLGWIHGRVVRFDDSVFDQTTHLPHMGWNDISPKATEPLFSGIDSPQFYFLHSYYFVPTDPDEVIAHTQYGVNFASAVRRENIWATQFHPEKSHHWGIALLRNFAST